jgi:hypothetical protein
VVLAAPFAAVRRVLPGFFAPPFARTKAESRLVRERSRRLSLRRSARSASCQRGQRPVACQSRRRRQQVMPDPQPISWGNHSHWMPVFNTKRMPLNAARSGMRGRPPLGRGGAGGSRGAKDAQSSSLTSCFALPLVYHNLRFC